MTREYSKTKKYYYEIEQTDQKRNEKGCVTQTNIVKIFRDVDGKLIATLEHRSLLHWVCRQDSEFVICSYLNSAVAGKDDEWKARWFKSYIVDCTAEKPFMAPIHCSQRGWHGFDVSTDGCFVISHTYSGYENLFSVYNISDLSNVVQLKFKTDTLVPDYQYRFNEKRETIFEENDVTDFDHKISDFLWVPADQYKTFWRYDNDKNVNGFYILSTIAYYLEDDMALTWPTYNNKHCAIDPNWHGCGDEDEKNRVETEYSCAIYNLQRSDGMFVQTGFSKMQHKDMTQAEFQRIYNTSQPISTKDVAYSHNSIFKNLE